MAAKLSQELQQAVRDQSGKPVELVDPETNKVYLLIERDVYDRLKPLFEPEPMTQLEQQQLIRQAGERAGWDDPEMDAYDRYDESAAEQS